MTERASVSTGEIIVEAHYGVDSDGDASKYCFIREEIVRCRDCRFCGKGQWGAETFPVCRRGIHAFQVSNDGFCAWGERRDA